jgi:hypothetical protein
MESLNLDWSCGGRSCVACDGQDSPILAPSLSRSAHYFSAAGNHSESAGNSATSNSTKAAAP